MWGLRGAGEGGGPGGIGEEEEEAWWGRGPGCVVSAAAVRVHVCVRVWCFVSSAAAAAAAVLWFFVYYVRKRSFKRAHVSERALCSAMARGHGVRRQFRSACRALRCTCRAPGRGTMRSHCGLIAECGLQHATHCVCCSSRGHSRPTSRVPLPIPKSTPDSSVLS